jgi:TPR repeat protein
MKKALITLVGFTALISVTLLSLANTTPINNTSFTKVATEYLSATHAKKAYHQGLMLELKHLAPNASPIAADNTQVKATLEKYMPWNAYKATLIHYLKSHVSKQDLQQATTFYQSTTGKAIANLQPAENTMRTRYEHQRMEQNSHAIQASFQSKAFSDLLNETKSADADAHAFFTLGEMYLHGIGTTANKKRAFTLMRKAAQKGELLAQMQLAQMYDNGIGTGVYPTRAMAWYLRAAKQGDPKAMYEVAQHYKLGRGVPKNPEKAAAWFKKSAINGVGCGKYAIGMALAQGYGVAQDTPLAKGWLSAFAQMRYKKMQPDASFEHTAQIATAFANYATDTTHMPINNMNAVETLQKAAQQTCMT